MLNQLQLQPPSPKKRRIIIITTKPSTAQEEGSKFLASVAVAALPTKSVVGDYSEETQAINSSPHTMVATNNISLQEDTIKVIKAPWEAEA